MASEVDILSPEAHADMSGGDKSLACASLPTAEHLIGGTNVVSFAQDDQEHPYNWPLTRRWAIVVLIFLISLIDNLATVMIVPAAPMAVKEFKTNNEFYLTLLVSIWELGEGIGPFLIAPLSERYGRLPVLHCGNVLFVLCGTGGALSVNISMLVVFRFLNGLITTSGTLGPSIVADLFPKEKRGTAMALAIAIPMTGPFISPVIGSYIAAAEGWRWTIWLNVIAAGTFALPLVLCFRETYQVKILERRVRKLKAETGNQSLRSQFQHTIDRDSKIQALTRPFSMLIFAPTVLIVSAMGAFTYGLSFVILTTLTSVMQSVYNFGQEPVGLAFLGRAAGNFIGIAVYLFGSDRYLEYRTKKHGSHRAEDRLAFMLIGAIALPFGLVLYGWTAERHVQFMAPIIGTGVVGFSLLLNVLPTQTYILDVYELHGASAVAINIVLRQLSAALLPLAGPALYDRLGLGWGNTVLAFLVIIFIPGIVMMQRFGEGMCNKQRFS